jgi:hypothetical protein
MPTPAHARAVFESAATGKVTRKSPLCDPNGAQPKSAGLCMDRSQPIGLIRRNCVAVVEDQKQTIRSNFDA